jgi:hypothetical protein
MSLMEKVVIGIFIAAIIIVVCFVFAIPLWALWNWLVPVYTYWLPSAYKSIPFLHMYGLILLIAMLRCVILPPRIDSFK